MNSKRQQISRPGPRSTSKSRSKQPDATPAFANFVIPLAGILTTITARLYDMAGPTPKSDASERSPLLSPAKGTDDTAPTGQVKKAARWATRNAVIVFMSALILGIVITLCLFFGGKLNTYCSFCQL
jgi:hypothetical protein